MWYHDRKMGHIECHSFCLVAISYKQPKNEKWIFSDKDYIHCIAEGIQWLTVFSRFQFKGNFNILREAHGPCYVNKKEGKFQIGKHFLQWLKSIATISNISYCYSSHLPDLHTQAVMCSWIHFCDIYHICFDCCDFGQHLP